MQLSIGTVSRLWTDLEVVHLPWPFPAYVEELPGGLAACIAIQASPTKEVAGRLTVDGRRPRQVAALQLAEGAAALAWIADEYPGLAESAMALVPLEPAAWRDLSPEDLAERARGLANGGIGLDDVPWALGSLALRRAPQSTVRRLGRQLAAWAGGSIEDSLEWFGDRFGVEVDVFTIDDDEGAAETGQARRGLDDVENTAPGRGRGGIPYPEWDALAGRYREDYVTVYESARPLRPEPPGSPRADLEAWFHEPLERRWRGRLTDGPDIDIDGAVDALVDLTLGNGFVDRVYRDRLREDRDLACALLLDASASLAHGALLDHELQLADALVDAMHRAGEHHAVYGFWSAGRHRVSVEVVQGFGQRSARPSAAQLRPRGQTRLGAAIRHVSARLAAEPVTRRALIVLSDGVPFDDGYEGAYANADVAKAVEEAEEAGIVASMLGLGVRDSDPLQELLGDRLCRVASDAELAPALADAHARLVC